MTTPLVSLLLCTVRDSDAYRERPEWDCIGKVVEDLAAQVDAPPFELVIVDGLIGHSRRSLNDVIVDAIGERPMPFAIRHVPPRLGSPWVRMRKVAISAYRNTGIAACRGELILNLDDCCVLPPNYVATFWKAWKENMVCLGMCWPNRGDARRPGPTPMVYGFGSYPRELALEVNGYDEAYDGGQGLEDADWSLRLSAAGLRQALVHLPGFDIEPQTGHSSLAINMERPIVKCCNQAWQSCRVQRDIRVANLAENWRHPEIELLVGPCPHLHGEQCGHHGDEERCAYLGAGFATALDPEATAIFDEPPVLDLRELREEYQ